MQMWLDAGILKRDEQPALYAYQQTYSHGDTTYRRRGFFARVRLEDFGEDSSIHPHEQTFSGPKEDRLKLMRATQANLSPVFGLYDDKANDVTDLLFEAVAHGKPLAAAELPSQDGKSVVLSELWAVTDIAVIKDIQLMMADKHVYIADGHHRYTSCLNYRREVSAARGTPLEHNDAANFCLFVLIANAGSGTDHPAYASCAGGGEISRTFIWRHSRTPQRNSAMSWRPNIAVIRWTALSTICPRAALACMPWASTSRSRTRPSSAGRATRTPWRRFSDDAALAGKSAPWRQLDVAILQHLVFERDRAAAFCARRREDELGVSP